MQVGYYGDKEYRNLEEFGYPLLYTSKDGHIYEFDEESNSLWELHPYLNSYKGTTYGYYRVRYNHRLLHVHRLIAMAWVDGYEPNLVVDHINEDSRDNRAENLQWVSRGVNSKKYWNSLMPEEKEILRLKYIDGLKKAHAKGNYKEHYIKLHNKGDKYDIYKRNK